MPDDTEQNRRGVLAGLVVLLVGGGGLAFWQSQNDDGSDSEDGTDGEDGRGNDSLDASAAENDSSGDGIAGEDGSEMSGEEQPGTVESIVDGLQINSHRAERATLERWDEPGFIIIFELENTGDQSIDITEYGLEATLYDGNDGVLPHNQFSTSVYESENNLGLDQGQQKEIVYGVAANSFEEGDDPADVAYYDLTLNCDPHIGEGGVYCE
jgi:hypothetical protein